MLFSSPIMMGDNNGGAGDAMGGAGAGAAGIGGPGAAGGGAFDEWGGQNPDIDPELAMALKISLEEERQRATVPEEKKETN
jgi:26S proteasome regulatory subunit N10